MSDMCKCCGKMEAVPAEALDMHARFKSFNFEDMPDEVRASVPPEILGRMIESMRNPPEIRVGFCSMCGHAGCDGETACKVPLEEWKLIDEHMAVDSAWEAARDADMLKWREEQQSVVRNAIEGKSRGQWAQVKRGYWRRVVETPAGNMIAEVLKVDFLDEGEYLSEVTLVGATDPRQEGAGMGIRGALSFEEAKAECDKMAEELKTEGPGMGSFDFLIGINELGQFEVLGNQPPRPDGTEQH